MPRRTSPESLSAYHLLDPATGNGLSIALFEDDVDVAQVKAAIGEKALEIGWNDVPLVRLPSRRPSTASYAAAEVAPGSPALSMTVA